MLSLRPMIYLLAGLLPIAASGCSSPADAGAEPGLRSDHLVVDQRGAVVFITQDVVGADVMEALFQGVIDTDERGCLRLAMEGEERPTAIWPFGFTLSGSSAVTPDVLDADGAVVGTVGGSFTIGGGIVAELSAFYGFTAADRELASAQCPGRYWIVGDIPAS